MTPRPAMRLLQRTFTSIRPITRPLSTTAPHQTLLLTSRPTAPHHPKLLTPFCPFRSMFIQTETTPNPSALKFLPGVSVLPSGAQSMEYLDGRETHSSPLARKLFSVDGVRSVFYGPDFITVTKSEDANWAHIKPEVFSLITEALNAGGSVVTVGETVMAEDTAPQEGDSEVVAMIKELLDTRIRPAIQEDGGDIEFRGFDEGKGEVKLKLRGACRTCDSSTVTLKNGIESMLMHYIEEVKTVTQVMDQEEEIAAKEFEKFEERLRMAKGPQATASAPLDTVEV
ncbi:scaffold protein Nfu/NifU N terminal-domain-containing protein [Trichophaea hybrida]|nr:scaffold protein Nfu/NifU N terminal-domain-containing protein [Trichophaea hybrida]